MTSEPGTLPETAHEPPAPRDAPGSPDARDGADFALRQASSPPTRPGDELELQIDSLAFGGEGVARLGRGRLRRVRRRRDPRATACARWCTSASAATRTRARWRCSSPSPERIAAAGRPSRACPGRCSPTSASSRSSAARSTRRCGGSAGSRASSCEEIVPALEQWRYRNKLEYSFGDAARIPAASCVCGFHAPAGGNRVAPIDDCLLASERGNRRARAGLALVPRAGPERLGARRSGAPGARRRAVRPGTARARRRKRARAHRRARRARAAAQPGRARRPAHRQAAGAPSSPPTASSTPARLRAALSAGARRATSSGVLWTRSRSLAETTAGGETELVWGEAELPERLGELDLLISAGGVLPDEHRDGRAAVRRCRRVRRAGGLGARVRPVLRHRHDRAHARPACGRAVGDRAGRAGGRRRDRGGAAQRDHQAPTSSPATSALALPELLRARRSPGRRSSSTRRARGSRRRSSTASSTPRPGASCTSPATPPRSPPTPPNSSRPDGRCAGCAPWTCSRRPTTSSASRCSSGDGRRLVR